MTDGADAVTVRVRVRVRVRSRLLPYLREWSLYVLRRLAVPVAEPVCLLVLGAVGLELSERHCGRGAQAERVSQLVCAAEQLQLLRRVVDTRPRAVELLLGGGDLVLDVGAHGDVARDRRRQRQQRATQRPVARSTRSHGGGVMKETIAIRPLVDFYVHTDTVLKQYSCSIGTMLLLEAKRGEIPTALDEELLAVEEEVERGHRGTL